jgi:hypothetical protein
MTMIRRYWKKKDDRFLLVSAVSLLFFSFLLFSSFTFLLVLSNLTYSWCNVGSRSFISRGIAALRCIYIYGYVHLVKEHNKRIDISLNEQCSSVEQLNYLVL